MKLNAVIGRQEMRDYFDLRHLEEQGNVTVEDGLVSIWMLFRYGLRPQLHARADSIRRHHQQPIKQREVGPLGLLATVQPAASSTAAVSVS